MQQPCSRCGYVSDRPARFCRQCGAPLFVENEATSATTRQQPRHPTTDPYSDAPYTSQLASQHRVEEPAPDTSRLYRPPAPPTYGNYQVAETRRSNGWKWFLIALLCFLLVGGGIGAMVISAIRNQQRAGNIAPAIEDISEQMREQIEREVERAKQERERAMEEARRAAEEAGRNAPQPPPPPPVPGELPSGLEPYKYPNAEVIESASGGGAEFVKMLTRDSVSKVSAHYTKQLGEPVLKADHDESVIFRVPGSPSTMITISENDEDSGKTEINVFRSRFQLPKLN